MNARDLTASGIIRALSTIDEAVRGNAETLAADLARRGIEASVEARGEGGYAVFATGADLFAREFGGVTRQPEGPIEEAIRNLKTGGTE